MNAIIITRLPWYISMPAVVAAAVILAVAGNVFAGAYFERTTLDDLTILTIQG